MTSVSKCVYIDKLDDMVNKYNNTYHDTIKMKPVDVKSNGYIDFSKEINNKNRISKIGDDVRIWKYKNVFAKCYTPNWSEETFVIKKVENTVPQTYVIMIIMGKKLLERFTKTNCKNQIKKSLELRK